MILSKCNSMSLSPLVMEVVRRFKEKLAGRCGEHVLEVRVFGSMARGDAHENSDLDLFVMIDEADRQLKETVRDAAYDVWYELDLGFSLQALVMDRQHFEELDRLERRIARDILTEGIVV